MKKFFAAIVLLVYGLSSSGMTLHLRYCCGKLRNVQLSPVEKKPCVPGMKHSISKPCCDEKEISLKLKGDYNAAKIVMAGLQAQAVTATQTQPAIFQCHPSASLIPEVFAPPPLHKNMAVLFCVFRI